MINNTKGLASKKSVRAPQNIHHVEQVLMQRPMKSVSLSQQFNLIDHQPTGHDVIIGASL
jgi:hypothetical protein